MKKLSTLVGASVLAFSSLALADYPSPSGWPGHPAKDTLNGIKIRRSQRTTTTGGRWVWDATHYGWWYWNAQNGQWRFYPAAR